MKLLLLFFSIIMVLTLCTTSQTLLSCTKEKTVYDTVIIDHYDTTILYKHDTIQRTLESCCNNYEATVDSYYPTGNSAGLQLTASAWTHDGDPENTRIYTRFDYSDLPLTSVIISARLSLYAVPVPIAGNFTDAHSGTANACYIQRITSPWETAGINWNNQPATTSENQAEIPQSISSTQDDTNIDITNLVKDMLANGNYGFSIRLQNENIYNIRQYCSSFYADAAKRPKLIVQYKKE